MKLGILGGTFDPIHLGHLLIAEAARDTLHLERVLFIPAADPPHKQNHRKSQAAHRQAMVELAIGPNTVFELSRVDMERSGPHYSTDTVRLVRQKHRLTAEECFFIIGSDSLKDLPTWHNPQELIRLCRLAVAARPGCQADLSTLAQKIPGIADRLNWVELPQVGIAGSKIRAMVQAGQSIRYQVTEPVRDYIKQHQLY